MSTHEAETAITPKKSGMSQILFLALAAALGAAASLAISKSNGTVAATVAGEASKPDAVKATAVKIDWLLKMMLPSVPPSSCIGWIFIRRTATAN